MEKELIQLKIIMAITLAVYFATVFFIYQILDDIKKENKELKMFFKEIFKNNFNFSTKHISDIPSNTNDDVNKDIE